MAVLRSMSVSNVSLEERLVPTHPMHWPSCGSSIRAHREDTVLTYSEFFYLALPFSHPVLIQYVPSPSMSKPGETLNVIIPSMSGASSTLSGNLPKYTYPQYRSSISTSYGSSRSISLELPDWSYENIIAMGATSGASRLRRRSAVEVGVIGMANTSSEPYGLPLWSQGCKDNLLMQRSRPAQHQQARMGPYFRLMSGEEADCRLFRAWHRLTAS